MQIAGEAKEMKYLLIVFMIIVIGCEGPVGPVGQTGPIGLTGEQGEQGEQLELYSWEHLVLESEVFAHNSVKYSITIKDDRFDEKYWYDVWIMGVDDQLHIDTFIEGGNLYGWIGIQSGKMNFKYIIDLTDCTLVIFTNYPGVKE